jgi:hypothetical protein
MAIIHEDDGVGVGVGVGVVVIDIVVVDTYNPTIDISAANFGLSGEWTCRRGRQINVLGTRQVLQEGR